MELVHQPEAVRAALDRAADREQAKQGETLLDASLRLRKIVTPLAVGQFLLSSLLTLTVGLILLGRVQARRLALQAMVAYALFLPLDYVVRSPIRAVFVDVLAQSVKIPSPDGTAPDGQITDPKLSHDMVQWTLRVVFGAQLAIVGMGLIALTRPRARAFFVAMSDRAREQEP
jgi:hypothetical protein